jgi:hypothetical protein
VQQHKPASLNDNVTRYAQNRRPKSCPSAGVQPIISSPWSSEWLSEHSHDEAGFIFRAKKYMRKAKIRVQQREGQNNVPEIIHKKGRLGHYFDIMFLV